MNKKILLNIIKIVIILCIFIMRSYKISFASQVVQDPASIQPNEVQITFLEGLGKNIVGVISNVGTALSVIIIVVIGIKYMIGSAEEKAVNKKAIIIYLIGAVILFASSRLLSLLYNIVQKAF